MADALAGLGPNPTRDEIEDELTIARVLLESLDDDADDYEAQYDEKMRRLTQLETLLDRFDSNSSSSSSSRQFMTGLDPSGASRYDAFQEWDSDVEVDGAGLDPISRFDASYLDNGIGQQPPITPPPASRPRTFTVDTGSRKRGAGPSMIEVPSPKRATPSPAPPIDGVPMRSTSSGFPRSQPSVSSQPSRSATSHEALLHRQRLLHQQAQQMKAQRERDAALANSMNASIPATRPSSQTTQSVFNRDGTLRRVSSQSNTVGTPLAGLASQLGYVNNDRAVKQEIPFQATLLSSPPPLVDSGDESSDLEEIDAASFENAARRRTERMPPTRPSDQAPHARLPHPTQSLQRPPQYSMPGAFPQVEFTSQQSPRNGYSSFHQQAPFTGQGSFMQSVGPYSNNQHSTIKNEYNGRRALFDPLSMVDPRAMHNPNAVGVPGAMYNRSMQMPGSFDPYLKNPYLARFTGQRLAGGPPLPSHQQFGNYIDLSNESDDEEASRRKNFGFLYNDASRTEEEIKSMLESISSGAELPEHLRKDAPGELKYPLYEHQKIGFTWMKQKEDGSSKGGILADDMGLGKTIQAISLMLANKPEDMSRKTTLIVAPVALLQQWKLEIADKIRPDKALSVFIHHNTHKQPWSRLKQYDVVLTTYGSLTAELKKKEQWEKIIRQNPAALPTSKEELAILGSECKWYRVILDESQNIKNKGTGAARASLHLKSIYRWCMTGTPMMNNVGELYSLINFCRLRPYNDIQRFRHDIENPISKPGRDEQARRSAMKKLQALLRAVMLRRTKASKIDGKPIITLPPRTTNVVETKFNEDEEDFYRTMENKAAVQFNKYLKEGSVMKNYSSVLALLLRLRQVCCHPQLAVEIGGAESQAPEAIMLELAEKLNADSVRRIKECGGEFTCAICMDAVPADPGPLIFFPCGHYLDQECFSTMVSAAMASDGEVKCPECRQKFDQKSVINYASFRKVHMLEEVEAEAVNQSQTVDDAASDSETASDSDDDDDDDANDSEGSLKDFVVSDGDDEDEAGTVVKKAKKQKRKKKLDIRDFGKVNDEGGQASGSTNGRRRKRTSKGKGKKPEKTKKTLSQLRAEGRRSKKKWTKYIRRLRKNFESSAKIDQAMELLNKISIANPRAKILIFSQFTSFLDLVEVPLVDGHANYRRYDGSMSTKEREMAVLDFKTDPQIRIMLVSLKAGNAGLNLNCASEVILCDPFWNFAVEEQAIDRAHRIGQTNEVNVHRLVVTNTVEDRILELQEKKKDIINSALDENAGKSLGRLSVRELGYLFGVGNAR